MPRTTSIAMVATVAMLSVSQTVTALAAIALR